jgi:hypothetical protein
MKGIETFRTGLIVFMVSCLGVFVEAQVVFTSSDFADPGSEFYYNVDTTSTGITPGPSGSGQSWTFNGLSVDRKDTLRFVDPSSTPFANDFPSATHAMPVQVGPNGNLHIYIQNASMGIYRIGAAGTLFGYTVKAYYMPDPLMEVTFPVQVSTTFTDSGAIDLVLPAAAIGNPPPGIDSVKVSRRTKQTGNADGDGTLTVDGITYPNVLRVLYTTFEESRYYAKGPLTWGSWVDASTFGFSPEYDTSFTYSWYSSAYGFSVFEIHYGDLNQTQLRGIRYLDSAVVVSVDPLIAKDLQFRIGKVPGKERTYRVFHNEQYELSALSVTDLGGREFPVTMVHQTKDQTEFTLPSTMASGAYVLKAVFNKQDAVVHLIVVE